MRRLPWLLLPLLLAGAPLSNREAGERAFAANDLPTAIRAWSTALADAQQADDVGEQVALLVRLAAAFRAADRLDHAGAALGQAEELATAGSAMEIEVRLAQAQLERATDALTDAERHLMRAFELARALAAPRDAARAAVLLAEVRADLGRLPEALRAADAAVNLATVLADDTLLADAQVASARVHQSAGRPAEAADLLELAVKSYQRLDDGGGEVAATLALANAYQALGRADDARILDEHALAAARGRKDTRAQATLLLNLGALAQAGGDVARARSSYSASGQAFTAVGRDRDALEAALRLACIAPDPGDALTEVIRRADQAPELRAEALLHRALATRHAQPDAARADALEALRLTEDVDLRWQALYALGRVELDQSNASEGVTQLRQAVDALEASRSSLGATDDSAHAVAHQVVYADLISALVDSGDANTAFAYAQRLQAVELPHPSPTLQALERRRAQLEAQLAAAKRQANTAQISTLQARLDEVRVDFSTQIDVLRAEHQDLDRLVRVAPEDLEALQGQLDPGVTVLQPIALPNELLLLVFRHDGPSAVRVPVSSARVSATAFQLARRLQSGSAPDRARIDELGDRLGEWLLAPIADVLADTSVLVVSTTGTFRQVPFGILRRDGRYLVQDVAVVGLTHVGSLRAHAATDAPFHPTPGGLLLLGNPDGTLPGAEAEVRAISADYPAAKVLIGKQGSREALLAAAPNATIVHLATHGRLDPAHPARSHLVLAGDDGELTYAQIPGLASALQHTRLVVLSACESALPVQALEPAGEDDVVTSINGLAAQFRRAGVETLIATLWSVDDRGTQSLMQGFYTELHGGADIAQSLRRAQLAMLADPTTANPWYWGGFVVVGDWR